MPEQNYRNHRKFYIPHHFVFYPVTFILLVLCISFAGKYPEHRTLWHMMAAIVFIVAWLSFMMRQHYAIIPQNRIIRLEMRLRYFQLTGIRFETVESKLTFSQIAALRFASDDELPALVDATVRENLQPRDIKKRITNWQADHMRV